METLDLLLRLMISENSALGRTVVLAITLMTVAGVVCAWQHYRRYEIDETNYLNQTRTRLEQLRPLPLPSEADATTDPNATVADYAEQQRPPLASTARTTVSAEALSQGAAPDSIIGDRVRTIAALRQSKTKVNLAALQQMSRAREAAKLTLRFPGLAANLLMLMGLLGTFIGIAIVIEQIGVNLQHGEMSIQALGTTFQGMYTKFSTTLSGIFGALILLLLNFRLAQAQERYFEELDRFTVVDLLPATVPALEDETLLEQIMERLEQGFTMIQDVSDQNAKTAGQVAAIQAGFSDIVTNMRSQSRSDGQDQLQALLGHVAGVIAEITKVNGNLTSLAAELPRAVSSSNAELRSALLSRSYPPLDKPKDTNWMQITNMVVGGAVVILMILILFKG